MERKFTVRLWVQRLVEITLCRGTGIRYSGWNWELGWVWMKKKLKSSASSCCFKKLWTWGGDTVAELPDGSELGTVISPLSPSTTAPSLEITGSGRGRDSWLQEKWRESLSLQTYEEDHYLDNKHKHQKINSLKT